MSRDRFVRGLLITLGLLPFVLPCSSLAQVTFERAYGGYFFDEGFSVQQTLDGGYIVAGIGDWYWLIPQEPIYLYLVKTDSLGDRLWSRIYGTDSTVYEGKTIQQTADSGYIIVGRMKHEIDEPADAFLLKTDALGENQWTRIYGGADNDLAWSVQEVSDGGYIIVGSTDSSPDTAGAVYLIRTDSLGDTLWTRTYGDTLSEDGRCVHETLDGGYIVTGSANGEPFSSDVLLLKTNSLGESLWAKSYGGPNLDHGYFVQQTSDGGYIVVGVANYWAGLPSTGDVYLIRTDAQGDSLWSRLYYSGQEVDVGECVRETMDGGYVITGATRSFGAGDWDAFLIKTDNLGNILWDTTYGYDGSDLAHSVWQTVDSGYVIAGRTDHLGTGGHDVYLVKTDKRGWIVPIRDYGITTLDSPPDTVFPDSMYEVIATMANYGNVIDSLYITASIDGYTDTLRDANVGPGFSIQIHFANWLVPSADSTTYTMTVCTHVVDDVDTTNDCMSKTIFAYNPTGVEEDLNRRPPTLDFRLGQNEPNPFQGLTSIGYSLPLSCAVSLKVYDLTGRVVETLVDEEQGPGVHQVRWDAKHHANGIYFYRLEAGGFTETRKLILLR